MVGAVERTDAEAVDPGYVFLSENVEFAQVLEDRGIVFVGPRPEHLRSFGFKNEVRCLAQSAGFALLSGNGGPDNVDGEMREAGALGYPVMHKSSADGGDAQRRRRRVEHSERLHRASENKSQGGRRRQWFESRDWADQATSDVDVVRSCEESFEPDPF